MGFLFASASTKGQVYERMFGFTEARLEDIQNSPSEGSFPSAALALGSDGNFYGTTRFGGRTDFGTVFRMTPSGVLTTLVEFTNNGASNKGGLPYAGLVLSADGNLYGTTSNGGANGSGTVFRMTPAGSLTTLVEFTGNGAINKGSDPFAGLALGIDGNFYGTTSSGGANNLGTVFRMTPAGSLTTLVEFTGNGASNKGSSPYAGLVLSSDGNFYGTTSSGGANNLGTVFRMTPAGSLTTLVEFTGNGASNKGSSPLASLALSSDGNYYGTTYNGGANNFGTVFRMTPAGSLATLVEFTGDGASNKGSLPYGDLVLGTDGNFYGNTSSGGANGFGTAFRITPVGSLTTLVEFTSIVGTNKGSSPSAAFARGSDGNFYGTTSGGGVNSRGTAFRMTPSGVLTTLVEFKGIMLSDKGIGPSAALAWGNDGNYYGSTFGGGKNGSGTIFRMTPSGILTTLVQFTGNTGINKGSAIDAELVLGNDGDFFGTTRYGGAHGSGTVFRMTPTGSLTTLVEFTGNGAINKGSDPFAGLALGSDGNYYGTTSSGGANNRGTVFRMTPAGSLTTLVEFTGNGAINKGSDPFSALALGSDGNFYGTTYNGGANNLGTVFRMTPAGSLTTLIEFTGNGASNKGSRPYSALKLGSDGNYYGTTSSGGANNLGTVFRMTPAGSLTTLVEFTGNGASNKGSSPFASLALGSDGNFYGTTRNGGANNLGTIFKVTPDGVLTTLVEFIVPTDGSPGCEMIHATDGNLYGTTTGPDGVIYRLVFPGAPTVGVTKVETSSSTAILEAKVNPRGAVTAVLLEYRISGATAFNTIPIGIDLNGFQSKLVGTTLSNLELGTTYQYRFRATSTSGATETPIDEFTTLAPPQTLANPATEILTTSARFNGTVNARNYEANVHFEWGTDGNTFPNSLAANPGIVTGNSNNSVSAPIAGLIKDTTYFYRIVANNEGGTTVSGTQSFRTPTDPIATIGGSFSLSTTSVRVEGAVDPRGSTTTIEFGFKRSNEDSFIFVPAVQSPQSGQGSRPVSAVLTNLQQGVTYHYLVRANSDGGSDESAPSSFSMNVLSGFTRVSPGAPPESSGFLLVNLSPSNLLHGWRFVGESRWRTSGVVAAGLPSGDRLVEFRAVPGHIPPPTELVSITSGGSARVLDRTYFENDSDGSGGLTVFLKPESVNSGPNPAKWRLLGEGDNAWRDSGAPPINLLAGDYVVECKPVTGRATPLDTALTVTSGQVSAKTLAYFEASSFPGELPAPLAFETVSQEPYAHVGQLRSATGSGTGFVVKERVVATAAHVVWDEGSLSAAPGLQWLHQRHAGAYEPQALEPRGFYLLSGYADQRSAEATPGSFSPVSRNLDVAALYFGSAAARGGYGGFLASDLDSNEFLLSNAKKALAGYPLDGIAPASQGRMHATAPFNVPFTPVGAAANRTYLTTAIRSSGGASGAPLLVQFEGGDYYPAGIYLGGVEQTVVRALDSAALELFNRAELSGIDGQPHVGGGITHTSTTALPGVSDRGALRVLIEPAGAVAAGALWRLRGEASYRSSGAQRAELRVGSYTLELSTVPGYQIPSLKRVKILAGGFKTVTVAYALPPVPEAEIVVRGNGRNLADGDLDPSALDHTDFGVVETASGSNTRTYAITNTGTSALSVGTVVIGGAHADDFDVTVPPGPSVPRGGSTSFTISFDPSAPGLRSATISFATNDTDENPFSFAIQGNNETDSDSDGFSDVEEAGLNDLLTTFVVGQQVDLDVSFLRLGGTRTLVLTGLPLGLVFDPQTMRITGTILAKPAGSGYEFRKIEGVNIVAAHAFDLPVVAPAQVSVTTLRRFATTTVGRRSRPQTLTITNTGEASLEGLTAMISGKASRDFLFNRPQPTLDPAASTNVTVVFKPRTKGRRSASLVITSNAAPRALPLSGDGKEK